MNSPHSSQLSIDEITTPEVFVVMFMFKIFFEIGVFIILSTAIEVSNNDDANYFYFPIIRGNAIGIFFTGLLLWPITTYYWLKKVLYATSVWLSLIITSFGSLLVFIAITVQVTIPAFIPDCHCEDKVYGVAGSLSLIHI